MDNGWVVGDTSKERNRSFWGYYSCCFEDLELIIKVVSSIGRHVADTRQDKVDPLVIK